uniref:G-protein alpha subunit n=1 Tax=Steinernema glaseri TaxID=37863 RepID=A0A1I7ZZC8_9BILA
MKILHNNGFSDDEMMQQRAVVFNNTVTAMGTMLKAMATYKVHFMSKEREQDARIVFDVIKSNEESEPFSPELAIALKNLWSDPTINTTVYDKRNEIHLNDSAKYFLDDIDRIMNPNYKPTPQDILFTRIKTTGIVEVTFQMSGVQFRVFDVGGQRSERKKWIHCFEDVNSVIFICAISEYDEVLFEDETTNRMVESLRLFDSICNSRWFFETSMILFLNKKDLFEEKIKRVNITPAFPEYKGAQRYDDAVKYIRQKFEEVNNNRKKTIFVHETCATDTNQVQIILESVISMIIQANLHKSGLY